MLRRFWKWAAQGFSGLIKSTLRAGMTVVVFLGAYLILESAPEAWQWARSRRVVDTALRGRGHAPHTLRAVCPALAGSEPVVGGKRGELARIPLRRPAVQLIDR